MTSMIDSSRVRSYLLDLQRRITGSIAAVDGGVFATDPWEKPPGETLQGNGITMILEQGEVFDPAVGYTAPAGTVRRAF
jgi:coproporphyrinogen III oxidase